MSDELNAIPAWDRAAWKKRKAAIPAAEAAKKVKQAEEKAALVAAKKKKAKIHRHVVISAATEYAKKALRAIREDPCDTTFSVLIPLYPPPNEVVDVLKKRGYVVKTTNHCYTSELTFDFETYGDLT
jgi:hypothetical protein